MSRQADCYITSMQYPTFCITFDCYFEKDKQRKTYESNNTSKAKHK